jgi:hypothetical protein
MVVRQDDIGRERGIVDGDILDRADDRKQRAGHRTRSLRPQEYVGYAGADP